MESAPRVPQTHEEGEGGVKFYRNDAIEERAEQRIAELE